jgi:hypothetical protein
VRLGELWVGVSVRVREFGCLRCCPGGSGIPFSPDHAHAILPRHSFSPDPRSSECVAGLMDRGPDGGANREPTNSAARKAEAALTVAGPPMFISTTASVRSPSSDRRGTRFRSREISMTAAAERAVESMSGHAGTGTVSGGESVALQWWQLTRRPAECVRLAFVSLSCCKDSDHRREMSVRTACCWAQRP